jgi:hypothetical protein
MHFLIWIPLLAAGCAAALRGLVAFLNHERGIFETGQAYGLSKSQREGKEMTTWDSRSREQRVGAAQSPPP